MTAFILTAVLSLTGNETKPEPTLDEKVATARAKAIEFLKKQQDQKGTWEGKVLDILTDMEGGVTALAHSLPARSRCSANDASIEKAVAYLVKLEPKKTYVVSLQTQILCRLDAKKYKALIQKNADWLLEKAIKKGDNLAGWSYPANDSPTVRTLTSRWWRWARRPRRGRRSMRRSGSRFATCTFRRSRKMGGATASSRASGESMPLSMTTCALLGLTIAAKHDKNAKGPDAAFEKGMSAWFEVGSGTKSQAHDLFAIAELGRVLDQKELKSGQKSKDWYRDGTTPDPKSAGRWVAARRKPGLDANPILTTAFGLYFLGAAGEEVTAVVSHFFRSIHRPAGCSAPRPPPGWRRERPWCWRGGRPRFWRFHRPADCP